MTDLYRVEREVSLTDPVMVMGLDGWVDAGLSGASAMAALLGNIKTEPVVTFDSDVLLDYRSRRPTQRIVDGVLTDLTWPEAQIRVGRDAQGSDVLLLVGPEPDHQWHAFTDSVVGLASEFGVRFATGLGGFPAPVPHTRPIRIVATAIDSTVAGQVGFIPGVREVPAGVHASLLKGFERQGIQAVSLWAMVPHYVAGMPFPATSLALLEQLQALTGLDVDTSELKAAAAVTRQRVDELIAQSAEHVEMVLNLESQHDAQIAATNMPTDNLPSGDEIAAELERFLRGEGQV